VLNEPCLSFTYHFIIYSADDLIRSDDDDEDDDLYPSDEAEESDDGMSFFEEEETKSRFTNYSMTSSVLRRNEGWNKQKANNYRKDLCISRTPNFQA